LDTNILAYHFNSREITFSVDSDERVCGKIRLAGQENEGEAHGLECGGKDAENSSPEAPFSAAFSQVCA
jgi:hypothetical protein